MRRILALVEGPTEVATLGRIVSPYLGAHGLSFSTKVVGKPGHKGGMRPYPGVAIDLQALLRQERSAIVTTFFDLYAVATDWPGYSLPETKPASDRAGDIEEAMRRDMMRRLDGSDDPTRFHPYLQVHELEALLYSDPHVFAVTIDKPETEATWREIVAECGGCEKINHQRETAPAARIERAFPAYKKGKGQRAHAPRVASAIGLDVIRRECPRFSEWVRTLEHVAATL